METAGAFVLGLIIGEAVAFLLMFFGYRLADSETERTRELIAEARDNTPELIPYG